MIFVVFSALAAVVNYELTTTIYSSAAPAFFIALSVLTAAVPFIVSAILSFTVAFVTAKSSEPTEKEPEPQGKLNEDVEQTSH
jgi:membrane protein implicated in regulation of membrane protease activity